MKKLLAALLAAVMLAVGAGCSDKPADGSDTTDALTTAADTTEAATDAETNVPAEKTDVRITTLKGPTGIGMTGVMDSSDKGETANNYTFTLSSAPDEVVAEIVKGNVDIAAVPTNLASTLYKKTEGGIKIAAINTLGVLYMLENGNTVNSVEDLRGKTVVATGQGSTPEYALRYILTKNGIDPDKDLTIEYKTEHSELATLMTSGDIVLGMLPEPNVTTVLMGNKDVRIALNLTEEWNKVADDGSALIMGCVVVSKDFAENHKDALDTFLTEYKASVEFVNSDIDAAAALCESYGIVPKAAVAKTAIPNCNIVYTDGDEMQTSVSGFLKVLFEANPASVGGALPDDAFYYKK